MKQYLLLCDDDTKVALENVIKGIEFLEVQGMNLNAENKYNLLVTPVLPPVNPAVFTPIPQSPVESVADSEENPVA